MRVIPGVRREETLRGPVWVIPRSALDSFENWKPKIGRPRKAGGQKAAKKGNRK